jgi:hypothetical protein
MICIVSFSNLKYGTDLPVASDLMNADLLNSAMFPESQT